MENLNRMLREKCQNYLSHQIRGKEASVGTMFAREKALLYRQWICMFMIPSYGERQVLRYECNG